MNTSRVLETVKRLFWDGRTRGALLSFASSSNSVRLEESVISGTEDRVR